MRGVVVPLDVVEVRCVPEGGQRVQVAFAAAAIISSGAVGCSVGGILGDRWGRTRLIRLAMALSDTCCVLIGPVAATCPGERVVPGRG